MSPITDYGRSKAAAEQRVQAADPGRRRRAHVADLQRTVAATRPPGAGGARPGRHVLRRRAALPGPGRRPRRRPARAGAPRRARARSTSPAPRACPASASPSSSPATRCAAPPPRRDARSTAGSTRHWPPASCRRRLRGHLRGPRPAAPPLIWARTVSRRHLGARVSIGETGAPRAAGLDLVGGVEGGGRGAVALDQGDRDRVGAGGLGHAGADRLVVVVQPEAAAVRGPTTVATTRPNVPRPASTLPTSWSRAPAISGRVAVGPAADEAAGDLDRRGGGRRWTSPTTARPRPASATPRPTPRRRRRVAPATATSRSGAPRWRPGTFIAVPRRPRVGAR